MNFNDGSSEGKIGTKPAAIKSNDADETAVGGTETTLDHEAMKSATRAQDRLHKNEQTNSSNTIFSK